VAILAGVKRGERLGYSHRSGRRAETGERYEIRHMITLPGDLVLRQLAKPKTKRNRKS
jgi:hypothetical protein